MAAKITHLNLEEGDSIIIEAKGSKEVCLFIRVAEDGQLLMYGPNNICGEHFKITSEGIRRIPASEGHRS